MGLMVNSTPPGVDAGTAEDGEVDTFLESYGIRAQRVPPGPLLTEVRKQSSRPRC